MHRTQAGAEKKTGHLQWISQILMELGAGMMNDPLAEETAGTKTKDLGSKT